MKTLINNLDTIFKAAIAGGTITKAVSVQKGLANDPSLIPLTRFGYIALDDGGERVEDANSHEAQNRIYTVIIEMGVYATKQDTALDNILDLSNEVKTSLETLANRQKDGHTWGINIQSFEWESEGKFFRGRTVTVEFMKLEARYFDY